MPLAEWDIPFTLTSTKGSMSFNIFPGWNMVQEECESGAAVRSTKANVPQADGSILHRRFYEGYRMKLVMEAWLSEAEKACGAPARELMDALGLHLRAMLNDDGRLQWLHEGLTEQRMLNPARLLETPVVTVDEEGVVKVEVVLDSDFPYVWDITEIVTTNPGTVVNPGNAEFYPVFKVYGPASSFTITNVTTGKSIVYDTANPGSQAIGGGSYAEIDTFRNVIYLNGNQTNLKPGVDIFESDFFTLVPGSNDIDVFGATVDMLHQGAHD